MSEFYKVIHREYMSNLLFDRVYVNRVKIYTNDSTENYDYLHFKCLYNKWRCYHVTPGRNYSELECIFYVTFENKSIIIHFNGMRYTIRNDYLPSFRKYQGAFIVTNKNFDVGPIDFGARRIDIFYENLDGAHE